MSRQSRFARSVEAGIRSGAVNPSMNSGIKAAPRTCDHRIGSGDEAFASGYVRVEKATGTVTTRTRGMIIGTVTGLTAAVAVTGETVTGKNRKELLAALLLAHNTHLEAS